MTLTIQALAWDRHKNIQTYDIDNPGLGLGQTQKYIDI